MSVNIAVNVLDPHRSHQCSTTISTLWLLSELERTKRIDDLYLTICTVAARVRIATATATTARGSSVSGRIRS